MIDKSVSYRGQSLSAVQPKRRKGRSSLQTRTLDQNDNKNNKFKENKDNNENDSGMKQNVQNKFNPNNPGQNKGNNVGNVNNPGQNKGVNVGRPNNANPNNANPNGGNVIIIGMPFQPTQPPSHQLTENPTFQPTVMPTQAPTHLPSKSFISSPTSSLAPTEAMSLTSQRPSSKPTPSSSIFETLPEEKRNSEDLILDLDIGNSSVSGSESTSEPTAAPSIKSTILLKMSVLMSEEYGDITAEDIQTNQDEGLILNLLQTTTISICRNTDYQIVAMNNPTRNLCDIIQNRRQLGIENKIKSNEDKLFSTSAHRQIQDNLGQEEEGVYAVLSFDPLLSVFSASDHTLLNSSYIEVVLRCEVEEIGPWYIRMSEMSFGLESPLSMIQVTAQQVLSESILDGSFFVDLKAQEGGDDATIRAISVLGNEEAVFVPFMDTFEETQQFAGVSIQDAGTYEVTPLHGIRVAGMLLLIATTFFTYSLFYLGKKRKEENEWLSTQQKKIGENGDIIQLSSEDAVTAMLNVGRKKTTLNEKVHDFDHNDDRTKESGPGWEVMIGNQSSGLSDFERVVIS